jgi:hypothetical protein
MPKIAYRTKNIRDKERLKAIAMAVRIIKQYEGKGFDLTLRQLYYQFVAHDHFPDDRKWRWTGSKWVRDPEGTKNAQPNYNWLGDIVEDGRMLGLIDWDTIVDRTRHVETRASWANPQSIMDGVYFSYHLNRWENQEYAPEVWVEKEALASVFEGVCRKYDVPLFCCRGYGSASAMWRASQRLLKKIARRKTPVILHFGDHDPSGIDMTRDIQDRLSTFKCDVEVRRLALNMDQVEEYDPPPNPAKQTDARFKSYMAEYGEESWELDALTPEVLNELVVTQVDDLRDMDSWTEVVEEEQDHRARLKVLKDKWPAVSAYLDNDHYKRLEAALRFLKLDEDYCEELGIEVPEDDE